MANLGDKIKLLNDIGKNLRTKLGKSEDTSIGDLATPITEVKETLTNNLANKYIVKNSSSDIVELAEAVGEITPKGTITDTTYSNLSVVQRYIYGDRDKIADGLMSLISSTSTVTFLFSSCGKEGDKFVYKNAWNKSNNSNGGMFHACYWSTLDLSELDLKNKVWGSSSTSSGLLANGMIEYCYNLETVILPTNLTGTIKKYRMFYQCDKLKAIIWLQETLPTSINYEEAFKDYKSSTGGNLYNGTCFFYVLDDLVDKWKSLMPNFADQIKPISEYEGEL